MKHRGGHIRWAAKSCVHALPLGWAQSLEHNFQYLRIHRSKCARPRMQWVVLLVRTRQRDGISINDAPVFEEWDCHFIHSSGRIMALSKALLVHYAAVLGPPLVEVVRRPILEPEGGASAENALARTDRLKNISRL